MSKYLIFFSYVLFTSIFIYSCQDDEAIVTPVEVLEEEDESADLMANIIEELTNNNSKIWRIDTAELGNNTTDLSSLFNIKDDEFIFTIGNSPTSLALTWKRGFAIGSTSDNESILSDHRLSNSVSDINIELLDNIANLSSSAGTFNGNINTATLQSISGQIFPIENSEPLNITLVPKESNDFVTASTLITNPIELFQFETGIFRVGFKISQAENALFITNRNDLAGIGSQQAFKYDLTNNTTSILNFTEQDFATKNIEFTNNQVVSVGGNKFETFEYDFDNLPTITQIEDEQAVSNGTATLDNVVYFFGGLVNGSINTITTWTPGATNLVDITPTPFELDDVDGEIIDQRLYIFGGRDVSDTSNSGSNIIYVYDLDNDSFSEIVIPVSLRETYTSIVENLIYVGGLEQIDPDGDGTFESIPYFGVFDTLTDTLTEIDLDLGTILDNRRLVHLQVNQNKAYFISSENLGAPDGFISRVYEADLN